MNGAPAERGAGFAGLLPEAQDHEVAPLRVGYFGDATPGALRMIRRETVPFDPDVAAAVLEHLAAGRTLTEVDDTAGLPSRVTIAGWRAEVPEFDAAYHVAIELRADGLIAEAEDVARDPEMGAAEVAARGNLLVKLAGMRSRRYAGAKQGDGGGRDGVDLTAESEARIAELVSQAQNLRTVAVVKKSDAHREQE